MSFSSIPQISAKPPSSDPFEIFTRRPSLPGTPNDLWGGQREALQGWVANRTKRDILVSLNTGSGKTMLGVLIAQSMANEPGGKCIYVCSTIDLVNQTEHEAKKLALAPSTYHSGQFSNTSFEQGKTFCITTYASTFNPQSTFKSRNVTKFVFDDAHVAEKAVRDSFTLVITRSDYKELYVHIAELLRPAFATVGQTFGYDELLRRPTGSILLVPPMLSLGVADPISEAVRSIVKLSKHPDLLFPYLYLKDHIKICAITVSYSQIEIAPPFLPTEITHPFSQEGMRRVYLSATLQTRAEFARAFGRNADVVIAPETDAGNGERCIVFGDQVPDEDTGLQLAKAIKSKEKLVIMCKSYTDAGTWASVADIPRRDGFSGELERFRKAKPPAAIVLVARVDGIDLPDEACRVMLIDDLPTGYTQMERFQIEHCAMTSLGATKLASRITQAFGRINRGRTDYGVFVLRGRKLNNWLRDAQNSALLPELLQKQLLFGEQVTLSMIKGKGRAAIMSVLKAVMAREPDWLNTYGDRITNAELAPDAKASAKEKDLLLTAAAIAEVRAIQLAWQGDYVGGAAALAETADKAAIADSRLAGWHNLWLGWFYEIAGDEIAAAAEYARARSRLGTSVFLPRPKSLKLDGYKITQRGSRLAVLLSEDRVSRFDREISGLEKQFAALSDPRASAAQHEEATRALGEALGFDATRPDNEHRTGPDVLWVDEEARVCLLFELKTLQQGPKPLTKTIVSQGHDHVQWVKNRYSNVHIAGLVFVADSKKCNADANPSDAMWVGPLMSLRAIASDFIVQLRTIRAALPIERLIKSNAYADAEELSIAGLRDRIAVCKLESGVC
jgi:hypothetical protein